MFDEIHVETKDLLVYIAELYIRNMKNLEVIHGLVERSKQIESMQMEINKLIEEKNRLTLELNKLESENIQLRSEIEKLGKMKKDSTSPKLEEAVAEI